jgi:CRISPR-associated protein Cas6
MRLFTQPLTSGTAVPSDHTYLLFSAFVSLDARIRESTIGIDRLLGTIPLQGGVVGISRQTRLRVRLTRGDIPLLVPMAGKPLRIGRATIRLGAPSTYELSPSENLFARVVTVKGFNDPKSFREALERT